MTTLHPSNPYYNAVSNTQRHTADYVDLLSGPIEQDTPRSASLATGVPSQTTQQPETASQQRRASVDPTKPRYEAAYRTRSIGGPFSSAVFIERDLDLSPPNDEEIIIATVRVTDSFRRASIEGDAELPARPPKRGYIRRVSTRVSSTTNQFRYTALKMPRKDYKRYFARDKDGNYAGTEPEREWSEAELQAEFTQYQEMPLRSIPGGQDFGEGVSPVARTSTDEAEFGRNWLI